jgi:hypothetical protein
MIPIVGSPLVTIGVITRGYSGRGGYETDGPFSSVEPGRR